MSSDPIINELSQLVALQAQAAVHNLRYGAAPGYANLAPDEALLGGQRVKKTRIHDAMGVGAPLPATSYSIHVQKGDNTSKIARREGVSVAALIAANPTKQTVIVGGKRVFAKLRAGEFLRTPRAARISVGVGEPLIDLSTDLEAECTNAGGTWNGSECVGPELQTGLDNINIPTGGSGGGAPRTGGGATRPSGGTKTTTTSMPKPESPSKTMAVLKALGIVAAGAAVVGGGVYLYKTKKKKR